MEGRNTVKSVQMALITFFAQTAIGVIILPSLLARKAGHDGWISVLMAGITACCLSALLAVLLRRYIDRDIYDINKLIFGRYLGFALNVLLVSYLTITTVAGGSLFHSFIRLTLLPRTPPWLLAPFITLPSMYLVWQGLKYMSRFLYISIFNYVVILILVMLLLQDFRLSFLMPFGDAGMLKLIHCMQFSLPSFAGFELIAFAYPWISDKANTLRWQIIANLISMTFFVIIVVVCTGIFGEHLLQILNMPFYNLSRVYNAPIVERVDLYLIALWFIPMACSLRCYVFAAFSGILKVFHLKKKGIFYIAYFTAVLILSSLPTDINQVFNLVVFANRLGVGVTFFMVMCLFASLIRRKGVGTDE